MKCLITIFIILFYCAVSANRPNKDYALFFAVDDYSQNSEMNNLRNPINDANTIANELKEMYGFQTAVYRNPTKAEIFKVLASWQGRTFAEDAQLFIFFSGHGAFWEFTKNGFFVPKGSGTEYSDYIELDNLGNIVTQIPCNHILLAIDACYSGTITKEIAFSKGDARFHRPGAGDKNEPNNIVSRQLRNKSRLILTSGGKERTSDGIEHSPFSEVFINVLREAYTPGDGLVLFSDLLSRLQRIQPVPHQGTLMGHESGGFVFVSNTLNYTKPTKIITPALPIDNQMPDINNPPTGKSFLDRDGNSYSFQRMKDSKLWMTANLNLKIPNSYCYDDRQDNCLTYGRLYSGEAAVEACAQLAGGWRLPTDREWASLIAACGGGTAAFRVLAKNETSSFSAQLGGHRSMAMRYEGMDQSGSYWCQPDANSFLVWYYQFNSTSGEIIRETDYLSAARSVRCIKE